MICRVVTDTHQDGSSVLHIMCRNCSANFLFWDKR